ncbi:MAG: enoyl-CoA hydratase-related protein [Chloroflexota bacterium]
METNHIITIRLDRPRAKNVIDAIAVRSLHDVCLEIEKDRSLRCAIVTGAGRRYFCAGDELQPTIKSPNLPRPASSIASLTIPVIAAINGHAFDAGLELVLACDIRIASEQAFFGFPGIKHGMLPSDGGTQRLPRLIGRGRAMELLLTGETINAARALDMGLVDEVVPSSRVLSRAAELAGQIAAKASTAIRYAKEAINSGLDLPLDQGLRLEGDLYLLLQTTSDRTEGVMSFRQKRTPRFTGD